MPPMATIGDIGTGLRILVDADACPVKEEIYKVAFRHAVPVAIVSNSHFRVPAHPLVRQIVVDDGFDAADDWIAARVDGDALIVTTDILLADRGLKAGGTVIAPNGKPFTTASIGSAIATRAIMADLRAGIGQGGEQIGGPPPFRKSDRSQFLQVLDREIVRLGRQARSTPS
ncbi:YaiI/YqxD family protein [Croceicoccus sp. YJ47]|uniref:YaiI/YqxD family protein n=1 Tax=Croceicoccus sp. YJ47 TaxID=2798724 RepID=UPI001F1DEBBC|nr:YaiI/YqxD family protein [Croceicoccus sp. YJ47]